MFFGATLSLVGAGCGGGAGDAPPPPVIVTVDGTLTIDSKPFGPAVLIFQHESDPDAPALEAKVNGDGKFETIIYPGGGKSPSGQYKVQVTEDPEEMDMQGVPEVGPATVDIALPAEGAEFSLTVDVTKTGDGMMTGGPALDDVDGAGP